MAQMIGGRKNHHSIFGRELSAIQRHNTAPPESLPRFRARAVAENEPDSLPVRVPGSQYFGFSLGTESCAHLHLAIGGLFSKPFCGESSCKGHSPPRRRARAENLKI